FWVPIFPNRNPCPPPHIQNSIQPTQIDPSILKFSLPYSILCVHFNKRKLNSGPLSIQPNNIQQRKERKKNGTEKMGRGGNGSPTRLVFAENGLEWGRTDGGWSSARGRTEEKGRRVSCGCRTERKRRKKEKKEE